ncbi:MAG: hypothetical protein C0621_08465 [Desulfuromonas sp.]|nr:MAG: hypothetical protein C0621_08465 [Desulfuromonas sp.]
MKQKNNLALLTHKNRYCPADLTKQGIFSNRLVGIEMSDPVGRIMEANSFFLNFVGYDENDLKWLTVDHLCHPDDKERELDLRQQLFNGGLDHITFRKRYVNKSGKTVWGETSLNAIYDEAGNCNALIATVVDATKYRREELLQKGQSRVLDLLYRNSSLDEVCNAIVRSIEEVEQGLLCSILQLDETTGTLHKLAAPSLPDFYNDAIEGMKIGDGVGSCGTAAFYGRRVVVSDIFNHPYWIKAKRLIERTNLRSCWSQPIFSNDGRVLGTFAIYYTEPREPGPFELDLIRSAADLTALAMSYKGAISVLEKNNQRKNEAISTAAHELRTPITSIMGYAELLRHTNGYEIPNTVKSDEFIDIIMERSEMLSRIVSDLFDISKIENGCSLDLVIKPERIHVTLEKVINHFKNCVKSHSFHLKEDKELPEILPYDEGRIIQALDNLLSNAVKYSPAGEVIELTAVASSDQLRLSVTDFGIGMETFQIGKIFDKFYRANSSSQETQGLGIGMSIVKEIIEAHRGRISVESAPGKGTTVTLNIPIRQLDHHV